MRRSSFPRSDVSGHSPCGSARLPPYTEAIGSNRPALRDRPFLPVVPRAQRIRRWVFEPATSFRGRLIIRLGETFDDEPASAAKLIRKLAQGCSLSADPQAIELHKLGIVQLDRDACPESVEVIGAAIGRHGYRHNRAGGQIKGAPD